MRVAYLAVCILCLDLLTACSDDTKVAPTPDATSADSAGDSNGEVTDPDTAADATADPDTAADATADPDTAADTSVDTTPDTAACEYFEEREIIVCGQANAQILHWKDFSNAGCAPYYTRGEDRYDTVEALAAAEGCDASCVYTARQAVDFIRCDGQGRSGWETYQADGAGCLEALYSTPDGIFPDVCLWAQYACHCEQ